MYNKRKKSAFPLDSMGFEFENAAISDDLAYSSELREKVLLLNSLPFQYRDILYLRFNMGYSVDEIARLLDLSKDNVKKRIERARNKLKEIIDDHESTESLV